MDDYSFVRYEKFGRDYNFGQASLADAAGTDAPQHLTNLKTITSKLDKAKAGQQGGSATPAAVLVDAVRLDVQNITRTARALSQDDPNYAVLFRPPEALNPRAVLTAADAILGNLIAEPDDDADTKTAKPARTAKFVAKGMPADFATQLQTDRAKVDDAHEVEDDADNDAIKNTAAIGLLITAGMKECNFLDAIYHNVYVRNPEKLRAWMSANHLERAAKPAAPPAPAPTTQTGTGSK